MRRKNFAVVLVTAIIVFLSCSRKHNPETGGKASSTTSTSAKPVVKKPKPVPAPRVIVVNDAAAKKSFDGRLYYDLEGRRYWRNYNDGKYYIFNKSMFSDSAYIPH